jgi:hypothetical protein
LHGVFKFEKILSSNYWRNIFYIWLQKKCIVNSFFTMSTVVAGHSSSWWHTHFVITVLVHRFQIV